MEVVHILQATRNPSQLIDTSVKLVRSQTTTYKLNTLHIPISLDELVDVSVFHPIGNQSKPVLG